jgi:hypothetical protein
MATLDTTNIQLIDVYARAVEPRFEAARQYLRSYRSCSPRN